MVICHSNFSNFYHVFSESDHISDICDRSVQSSVSYIILINIFSSWISGSDWSHVWSQSPFECNNAVISIHVKIIYISFARCVIIFILLDSHLAKGKRTQKTATKCFLKRCLSFALSGPRPQFPTSPSSLPPPTPPLHLFSTLHRDRREGRWCVTDAIFRLSVREINIDTVFLTRGLLTVCWALISLSAAQPRFFLRIRQ